MIKRILTAIIVFITIALVGGFTNQFAVKDSPMHFNVHSIYWFFCISSIFIVVLNEYIHSLAPSKSGYLYLALIFVKFGFFTLIFKEQVFFEGGLNTAEKLSLMIPLFVYLMLEGLMIYKVLADEQT